MNLIKFIIVLLIITILLACSFLANSNVIYNYLSETTLSAYDRYDIHTIDNNDVKNINRFMQIYGVNNLRPENTSPNNRIPDENLLLEDKNRNLGTELPWDREVGFCEVLDSTDRDLYKNVQDSTTITFY
jgi:hypothetical protein